LKFDIDLVYCWVDGNDEKWREERDRYIGTTDESTSMNSKARYIDNEELKYSLRSIEKYAPWIRYIFIVTYNQTPSWLNTSHPKIKMISHSDIIPKEYLPCFNVLCIEHFIHKIPELSEHYIYANDDMFINQPVTPETFFTSEGKPTIWLRRFPFRRLQRWCRVNIRKKPNHQYDVSIDNASELVQREYGKYYTGFPHHNMDAYLKSFNNKISDEVFKEDLEKTYLNRKRSFSDIFRVIYSYSALAVKKAVLKYVNQQVSLYMRLDKRDKYKKHIKRNPVLFCLNDTQHTKEGDRETLKDFLNGYFPDKSQFEL